MLAVVPNFTYNVEAESFCIIRSLAAALAAIRVVEEAVSATLVTVELAGLAPDPEVALMTTRPLASIASAAPFPSERVIGVAL
jgi:hypothetical protein